MWDQIIAKLKALISNWATMTTIGSFVLYFLGYLVLRFRLTTLGVGADLQVVDERYLFEGIRFLIFFVTSIPIAMLIVILFAMPFTFIFWIAYKIFGNRPIPQAVLWLKQQAHSANRVAALSILFSLLLIQLIMRQCLLFNNLLMRETLPEPKWLQPVLLSAGDDLPQLYFPLLILGIAISGGMIGWIFYLQKLNQILKPFYVVVLFFLFAVQVVLFPINYGTLIGTNVMPRVVFPQADQVQTKSRTWLIWEGQEGMTYFIINGDSSNTKRKLVTIPKREVKQVEILSYDLLLSELFASSGHADSLATQQQTR